MPTCMPTRVTGWRSSSSSTSCTVPTHGGATMTCTNLTGHPTLVLPVGSSDLEKGRPTVLGLTGGLYGEAALLHVAASWQRETDWHRRRPTLQ